MKLQLHEYKDFFRVGLHYRVQRAGDFLHTRRCVSIEETPESGRLYVNFEIISGGSGPRNADIQQDTADAVSFSGTYLKLAFRPGLQPFEYTLVKPPSAYADIPLTTY